MPIYRKTTVQTYVNELETYYKKLYDSLTASQPSSNIAEQFHANPEQFHRDFVEIDLLEVDRLIKHFKVAVESMRDLKKKELQAQTIHRGNT